LSIVPYHQGTRLTASREETVGVAQLETRLIALYNIHVYMASDNSLVIARTTKFVSEK